MYIHIIFKKKTITYLFHINSPDKLCISFNNAPNKEDFPLPLFPTIKVNFPIRQKYQQNYIHQTLMKASLKSI